MKLDAFTAADCTGGTIVSGSPNTLFTGVSTDSRTVGEGDLFVALAGERFDGHAFVSEAFSKGAAGAMVMRDDIRGGGTVISVDDTLAALGDLAGHVRSRYRPVVVGITGSAGKTTTKELCASILSLEGPCLKTEKNYNNLIGVPLSVLSLTDEHKFAVIEMGTNRFGEIGRLASIVRPRVAILTNINPVHLSGLRNISGVVREKQAIFSNTVTNGIAVIDPFQDHMNEVVIPGHLTRITYSCTGKADVTLKKVLVQDLAGTDILMDVSGAEIRTRVPLPGMHNVSNALAAAACALGLNSGPDVIARGIMDARFPGMRSEVVIAGPLCIINDSYNANPASMKAALEMLVSSPRPYRVAVLGDMLELGGESAHWHEELGKWTARARIDRLIATGEMSRVISDAALRHGMNPASVHIARNLEEIIMCLMDVADRDAAVLVKASRALHLDEVVDHLKAVARP
ncbi:MAG TPA: UDP-N-acetylmuramoyl-tripeptide--D-alanyl-D-alanine ligase [Deltaproteobacteria bacterium]|mgnify:FL=1|nr:UDP-N-acetylmuramoyl-tripeptide--D-alanyl-D-alanine ligase [Deltaproteobacteria bacterium]